MEVPVEIHCNFHWNHIGKFGRDFLWTFLGFHWDTNGFPLESRCKTTVDSTEKTVESAVVLHRDSSGNQLVFQ